MCADAVAHLGLVACLLSTFAYGQLPPQICEDAVRAIEAACSPGGSDYDPSLCEQSKEVRDYTRDACPKLYSDESPEPDVPRAASNASSNSKSVTGADQTAPAAEEQSYEDQCNLAVTACQNADAKCVTAKEKLRELGVACPALDITGPFGRGYTGRVLEAARSQCEPAWQRHCSSKCDGEYGLVCFPSTVCNPETHRCEKTQP